MGETFIVLGETILVLGETICAKLVMGETRYNPGYMVTWLHALTVSFSAIIDGSHVRSKTTIKAFTNYCLIILLSFFF